jgi:hypothetical protein
MVFRSVLAGLGVVGVMMAGAASAQVLLCPDPPSLETADMDLHAEARRLLKRLSVAFDLYDHDKIDQAAILKDHQETPASLAAKLSTVANRCAYAANDGVDAFQDQLPDLRRLFLEATGIDQATELNLRAATADATSGALAVKPASGVLSEAERIQHYINLSPRQLWQKLWFRSLARVDGEQRWAVIVASPESADVGWDMLTEHQQRWSDVYFELHEPYYEQNRHHALIVGRRLRRPEAERLLTYARKLGMAEDAYVWPVPDDDASAGTTTVVSKEAGASEAAGAEPELRDSRPRLDLTVLEN